MLLQRFACEPLAQNAYVVAHDGEALVVDPPRDADALLAFVAAQGLRVRTVLATHVHADFVAGLGEVAAATGAEIALGERFAGKLPCRRLAHGEALRLGDRTLPVLATPGHTVESVCLLLPPTDTDPGRLLTGDTLFVGDVGRPDLAQGPGLSAGAMAAQLFTSLGTLHTLPDDTEIWPAHGAGSACGSHIAGPPSSTLGAERRSNWALQERDPARFAARLLAALRPPPRYFAAVAAQNRDGPRLLAAFAQPPLLPAPPPGVRVLDVRTAARHGRAHWPGALNVGLADGEFEPWAAALLVPGAALVVHADDRAQASTAWRRLLRVGVESVQGLLTTLPEAPATLPQIEALDLLAAGDPPRFQVVDVRRPDEFAAGHVPGAHHVELQPELDAPMLAGLDRQRATAVLCDGGYRSSAACALLRAAGFAALHNVHDGMRGWRQNHLPLATGAAATATS